MPDQPVRRLGGTDITAGRVAFGGIALGQMDPEPAAEVLNCALDRGVDLFDTSWNYAQSEAHIGRAISHRRGEYALVSKTGKRARDEARAELEKSLGLLRTDHLDLCMAHTVSTPELYEQVTHRGGAYEALCQARDEGLIRHIGLSVHRDLRVMRRAITSGLWEAIMVAYSIIDQENVGQEILQLARDHNVGVLIMKALAGGSIVPAAEEAFTEEERVEMARDSIRWVLGNPNVDVVLVGMANPREVEIALEAATSPQMAAEETDRLRRRLARREHVFRYGQVCLRCGYCQPCPQGIPVPEIFRAADAYKGYSQDLRPLAEQMYRDLGLEPGQWQECRQCVEKCPAGINIPERLKAVAKAFERSDPDLL